MEGGSQRVVFPILAGAIVALTIAMSILGIRSIALMNHKVGPVLEANATVVGERIRDRIESAVALGIPYDQLVGVEDYLTSALEGGPGVSKLALTTPDGKILYQSMAVRPDPSAEMSTEAIEVNQLERFLDFIESANQLIPFASLDVASKALTEISLELQLRGETLGNVVIEIDRFYVARQLRETTIDIAVMAGIAFLLAAEILIIVISTSIRGPLAQYGRVTTRVAQRDFEHEAVPVGSQLTRETIRSANALVARVNRVADRIRNQIETLRSDAVRGLRGVPEATLSGLDARLSSIGRFQKQVSDHTPLAATQLVGVRGAAFLFVLAEELTRPFMPIFIGSVAAPTHGDDPTFLIAVPISAFMLGLAVAGPIAAGWSDRAGRRTSYVLGALLSTIGLVWTAYASGMTELVLSRGLSGFGYALTFVACQGHVIDRTDTQTRTRGMSIFVGGIMAADICGPAIGGIVAEQIGYQRTLIVAGCVALSSALLAFFLLDNDNRLAANGSGDAQKLLGRLRLDVLKQCFTNSRFVAVVVLAAIPAKMLLTGFLFFLVPLLLLDLGASDSEIGRITMVYGVSALFLMPVFAGLCDRLQAHGFMVGLGALIAGWALVPLVFEVSWPLITLAVLALGMGQAMSIPAQSVLVTLLTREEIKTYGPGQVLGVFRLSERIGSVIGPLVAAQLASQYGLANTAAIFGFFTVTFGTVFAALFLSVGTNVSDRDDLPAVMGGEL